jgi:subtilisin
MIIVFILLTTSIIIANPIPYRAAAQPMNAASRISNIVPTSPKAGDIIPNSFIVTLKDNATKNFGASSGSVAGTAAGQGLKVTANFPKLGIIVVNTTRSPSSLSASTSGAAINALQGNPNVLSVEPDRIDSINSQTESTGFRRIGASSFAPGDQPKSVNATIAILDSGVDSNHTDLNVLNSISFVPGEPDGMDHNGHGTHVAGIAAAKNNNIGVFGIAPGARILALKVCTAEGGCPISSQIAALNYVVAHAGEIDAVNMSLGGLGTSTAKNVAIKHAFDSGVPVIVAAGNDNNVDAADQSPANAPFAFAVSAALDSDGKCGGTGQTLFGGRDDSFAFFSSFGGSTVKMMAPGVNINSTTPTYTVTLNKEINLPKNYGQLSGTSQASPHVAGAAALYKSLHPHATTAQVYNALITSGSRPNAVCDGDGHGYILSRTFDHDSVSEPLLYVKGLAH